MPLCIIVPAKTVFALTKFPFKTTDPTGSCALSAPFQTATESLLLFENRTVIAVDAPVQPARIDSGSICSEYEKAIVSLRVRPTGRAAVRGLDIGGPGRVVFTLAVKEPFVAEFPALSTAVMPYE